MSRTTGAAAGRSGRPGRPGRRPRRRRWVALTLLVLFVVVPLVEIYVLIQVGQVIGAWWTVLLLVLDSVLGAWLVRREGARAWQALREALGSGRMPATELADAALVLVGGTLMMAPGFVTDVVAFFMILPVTRPLFRRLLGYLVARRVTTLAVGPLGVPFGFHTDAARPDATRPGRGPEGPVVRGEVVDDD
jgi:UPF0716 protein FxsA